MQAFGSAINKKLFWREFWILFGAGAVADASLVAIARLPTTPLATFLFMKGDLPRLVLWSIAVAETVIELGFIVGLGLLAAHSIGLGAPIVEKWLRGDPIRPHLRFVFVPALVVGVLIGAWSTVPHLPILHPNRQRIHNEADKIMNSPQRAKIDQVLRRTSGRDVTPTEITLSYVFGAVSGELTARLFLLSGIAWMLARAARICAAGASDIALDRYRSGSIHGSHSLPGLAIHIRAVSLRRLRNSATK